MSRTIRGSKGLGYDYGAKRTIKNSYFHSPEGKSSRTSMKKITNRRERCAFRSKPEMSDY